MIPSEKSNSVIVETEYMRLEIRRNIFHIQSKYALEYHTYCNPEISDKAKKEIYKVLTDAVKEYLNENFPENTEKFFEKDVRSLCPETFIHLTDLNEFLKQKQKGNKEHEQLI